MDKLNTFKISKYDLMRLKLVKNGENGATSKVYRLNESECLKIFNYELSDSEIDKFNKFTNLHIECVNFPKKLVVVNRRIKGYISEYIDGDSLDYFTCNDITDFVNAAKPLFDALISLSNQRIRIFDSHEGNIMYNYNTRNFEFIDPVEWAFDYKNTLDQIREKNINLVKSTIKRYFFHNSILLDSMTNCSELDNNNFFDFNELKIYNEYMMQYEKIKVKTNNCFRRYNNECK